MDSSQLVPVILSGGAGTRLWPLSRETFPKQLLPLCSERTLLQETALRLGTPPVVVCNQEHRFIVAEQLRQVGIDPKAVIIEPMGRNTAPAAAVAALSLDGQPDTLMLVMPSDHMIRNAKAFRDAVELALPLARDGFLVTFGITPTEARTGFGYIRRGEALGGGYRVDRFAEKPDAATAEEYVASGEYYWNSGIFLFSPESFLAELAAFEPDMVESCRQALAQGQRDLFFLRLSEPVFAAMRGQSIDYAVMEHTRRAAVIPVADLGWSDVGSWSALWQEETRDEAGNVLKGDVVALDTVNSYVRSEGRLVTTVGVENLVVVATDDAVLVADRNADQDVKLVVDHLNARSRREAKHGARTWRPWGWFETTDHGERFRVKHIQVDPGAKLSLQKHWHRSEHWVVVTGTAIVTKGDESFVLRENESTFIPAGVVHRLENPGRVPLRLVEVQSGEYVGEDDIVRIEDDYGR
ncbi:mannose-1-phosphate guanylyltransferase/mannose-6-phosphate isomerase [Magnetospirillum aberrantis]|uniref:mannose-1-phosphate guanylyltransferase n=1 Tax=Magnetospirillum aberrantis SpK TaxID=908842 RepID=A0A7C9UWQ9_9PROT|nr:mannose-1-phosphate guanylyltransferase/mannose-6-phosphate isomerase [Magnetospirillum aberrantis]NFV78533.1 mannose-1-phosphate guanylyltransferase/mannose-6-phosphate isomerase [Magnetospirillum aberrantis SpK]